MAQGDVTFFDEALKSLLDGTFDLDGGTWKVAVLDNTTTPTASDTTPALADYTQVGTAGSYVAGGTAVTPSLTEVAGVVTFDLTTNPSWALNALNDTDAYWGLLYDDADPSDSALGFIDLGGPIDMTADDLSITWNGSGVATLQRSA